VQNSKKVKKMPNNTEESILKTASKNFGTTISLANKQLSTLGKTIKQTSNEADKITAFKDFAQYSKKLSSAFENATKKLNASKNDISATSSKDVKSKDQSALDLDYPKIGGALKSTQSALDSVDEVLQQISSSSEFLADIGIDAAEVGGTLGSAYRSLVDSSQAGSTAIEKMQSSISETRDAYGTLKDAYGEASSAAKDISSVVTNIFNGSDGSEKESAYERLKNSATKGIEAIDKMKSALDKTKGTYESLTDSYSETSAAVKKIFSNKTVIENSKTTKSKLGKTINKTNNSSRSTKSKRKSRKSKIGGALRAPKLGGAGAALGQISGTVTNVANRFNVLTEKYPALTRNVDMAIAKYVGFENASMKIGSTLGFLGDGLSIAGQAITAFSSIMGIVTSAIGPVITAVRALSLAVIANPIGAIIAGIAVSAVLVIKYWKPISAFFANLFGGIVGWIQKAFKWINIFLNPLKTVGKLIGKAFNFMGGIFGGDKKEEKKDQSEDLDKKDVVGNVVKKFSGENAVSANEPGVLATTGSQNLTANNASNSGANSTTNISVSAPITINSSANNDELNIAEQVKIALDEVLRQFGARQQTLNYDS
jgi:hypothetical protein